jgi:hypothetical protein
VKKEVSHSAMPPNLGEHADPLPNLGIETKIEIRILESKQPQNQIVTIKHRVPSFLRSRVVEGMTTLFRIE